MSVFKKRIDSFKYAFKGIYTLFRSEFNARFHLVAALSAVLLGWHVELSSVEWCIVILTIALVLAAEGFNTAIEFLTNLVSPDHHSLAGATKDVAAGSVLIVSIAALIVGTIIYLPKLLNI